MEDLIQEQEKRFGGIARLYGRKAFNNFQKASVLVVGLGGVGSWAVEALGRSAIGRIGLMDLDEICVSNTNRQLQALTDSVGRSKVEYLAERLLQINPAIQIESIEDFLDPDNAATIMTMGWDYVIDATDSLKAKVAMVLQSRSHQVPLIIIGGAGGQIDPTQIKVEDLSRTTNDPLASQLRYQLRKHHNFPREAKRKFHLACVYSTEQLRYPDSHGETCLAKPAVEDAPVKLDCAQGFGASMAVTSTFAMVAVAHILSEIATKELS